MIRGRAESWSWKNKLDRPYNIQGAAIKNNILKINVQIYHAYPTPFIYDDIEILAASHSFNRNNVNIGVLFAGGRPGSKAAFGVNQSRIKMIVGIRPF